MGNRLFRKSKALKVSRKVSSNTARIMTQLDECMMPSQTKRQKDPEPTPDDRIRFSKEPAVIETLREYALRVKSMRRESYNRHIDACILDAVRECVSEYSLNRTIYPDKPDDECWYDAVCVTIPIFKASLAH